MDVEDALGIVRRLGVNRTALSFIGASAFVNDRHRRRAAMPEGVDTPLEFPEFADLDGFGNCPVALFG